MINIATVFSGIGSAEWAFKEIGVFHKIVFACDNGERYLQESFEQIESETQGMTFEKKKQHIENIYEATGKINYVQDSYIANYDVLADDFYQDIRFLDGNMYRSKVDILIGGSPCQSFSISGRRAGLEDARGTLFFDYARIVKEVKPKAFIFENVPGLLSHDKGNTFKIISEIFDSLGYDWRLRQLNAKDYGIPQNRTRVFVVGFRKDIDSNEFSFPAKMELTKTVSDFLDNEVPREFYHGEKGFKWVTNEKNLKKRVSINQPIARTQAANQQFNWCGDMVFIPIENAQWALTDNRVYVGEYQGKRGVCRKLTPRECLRLMGYGDDFKIVVPEQQMYRQCGNSIVVNVIKRLIEQIIDSGVLD